MFYEFLSSFADKNKFNRRRQFTPQFGKRRSFWKQQKNSINFTKLLKPH